MRGLGGVILGFFCLGVVGCASKLSPATPTPSSLVCGSIEFNCGMTDGGAHHIVIARPTHFGCSDFDDYPRIDMDIESSSIEEGKPYLASENRILFTRAEGQGEAVEKGEIVFTKIKDKGFVTGHFKIELKNKHQEAGSFKLKWSGYTPTTCGG